MSAFDFMTNIAAILAIMALISAIELIVPLFPRPAASRGRTTANFGLTATAFLINWAFTSAAAVLTVAQGPGLMARMGVPAPVQFLVGVVALDFFFGYLAHVAMHHIPPLWRVHAVHHSDPFVDVTTTYRTHPVESIWRSLFMLPPVWLLGIPPSALVVYKLLSAINGLLEHANLRVWPRVDRLLSLVWVTPNMHKIHHSRERDETNSNYGNLFSVPDRLFRTFTDTRRASSIVYGLDGVDPHAVTSLPDLLTLHVHAAAKPNDAAEMRAVGDQS